MPTMFWTCMVVSIQNLGNTVLLDPPWWLDFGTVNGHCNKGWTYIQIGLPKLCGCGILIIGGASNENSGEILVRDTVEFLKLEKVAVDSRLVQETAKSNVAARCRIGRVAHSVVEFFETCRGD